MFNLESTNTVVMPYLFDTNHWVLIIVSFEAKMIRIIDPICPNALFPRYEFVTERLKLFLEKVSRVIKI
jgi:hypothetical protein